MSTRIVSKEKDPTDSLWLVIVTDGENQWKSWMTDQQLRKHEIEIELEKSGANMDLVSELIDIAWAECQDSMRD
jgi:hypothetical protein